MIQDGIDTSNYGDTRLVNNWAEFIDWQKRHANDGQFLLNILAGYKDPKVLDVCVGDGCDAIFLLQHGFKVVGNEVDEAFRAKALANAAREGVSLKLSSLDWRKLDTYFQPKTFDVVTCMGNSFTYLFGKKHQLAALRQFKKLLKPDGILLIDQRNYQYMLDNSHDIIDGSFRYKGTNTYCGNLIHGQPISITRDKVTVEYSNSEGETIGRLSFYPFKKGELHNLLKEVGFDDINQWSDFSQGEDQTCDFFQYIVRKR